MRRTTSIVFVLSALSAMALMAPFAARAAGASGHKSLLMRHRGDGGGGGGGDAYGEAAWSWLDFTARGTLYSDTEATTVAGDGQQVLAVRDRAKGRIWSKSGSDLTQTDLGVSTYYKPGMTSRGGLVCSDYLWDGAEVLGTSNLAYVCVFSATGPIGWNDDLHLLAAYGVSMQDLALAKTGVFVRWGYSWPIISSFRVSRDEYFFDGRPHVVSASLFGGATTLRIDGVVAATSTATSGRKWTDRQGVGNGTAAQGFTIAGVFHEVLVYDEEVDFEAIESALIAKYGITRMTQ